MKGFRLVQTVECTLWLRQLVT